MRSRSWGCRRPARSKQPDLAANKGASALLPTPQRIYNSSGTPTAAFSNYLSINGYSKGVRSFAPARRASHLQPFYDALCGMDGMKKYRNLRHRRKLHYAVTSLAGRLSLPPFYAAVCCAEVDTLSEDGCPREERGLDFFERGEKKWGFLKNPLSASLRSAQTISLFLACLRQPKGRQHSLRSHQGAFLHPL